MNLKETVSVILEKPVTQEEARAFADEQFGTLMSYVKNKDKSTKQLVNDITDFVNSFNPNTEEFNTNMSNEHRTLQQSFTRLCLGWLEHCASEDYHTDLRNQESKRVSRLLIDNFTAGEGIDLPPSKYLPYI